MRKSNKYLRRVVKESVSWFRVLSFRISKVFMMASTVLTSTCQTQGSDAPTCLLTSHTTAWRHHRINFYATDGRKVTSKKIWNHFLNEIQTGFGHLHPQYLHAVRQIIISSLSWCISFTLFPQLSPHSPQYFNARTRAHATPLIAKAGSIKFQIDLIHP